MKKNTYKFSVDVVFAYNIFSTDTQKNLNFTVTTDICRDNFSDAVAAFKTYVRYITHDMIELSIPDLVEKRVEGILSISYECEQEGYFETDTNAVCVDSERIWKTTMSSYTPIRIAKTAVRRSLLQAFAMIIPTANGLFSTSKI